MPSVKRTISLCNFEAPPGPRRSCRLTQEEIRGTNPRPLSPRSSPSPSPSPSPSSPPSPDKSWPALKEQAKERLRNYHDAGQGLLKTCLHSCLTWFPIDSRQGLAESIIEAATDESLDVLYKDLLAGLFIPISISSAALPASRTPLPPMLQLLMDGDPDLVPLEKDASQARYETVRDTILERDAHVCAVTGWVDTEYHRKMGLPTEIHSQVEVAFIIPFMYGSCRRKNLPQDFANCWDVLYRCFPEVRRIGLSAEGVDSPENGFALISCLRDAFKRFAMAFKPTSVKDQYELIMYQNIRHDEKLFIGKTRTVNFRRAKGCHAVPLPDPALFDCHYRIAEIVHASSLANVIDGHNYE
ncbi:uncharacterized protein BO80DRAFT_476996 [Aspergillus ibericus CBS 121593]|uniref:HNH nuclease domain-containing protein n=1 Tax=Aspergillus ibericus CBS 121593 TaxID=1448316 RepID=A0A395GZ61_9EURO|nr:hypothetical protein BO80DRAFT_476996 [Aspergillus ibericus CBS 121593]RAK99967.1 hypothetical protein BO80DRAFT_476996 [Aspergillus ibericus CBS 121593]